MSSDTSIPSVLPIELGRKYKDTVTGFKGTATAYSKYLNGCERIGLEHGGKDNKTEEAWFDIQRLISAERKASKPKPTGKTGGPRPAAPRTGQKS